MQTVEAENKNFSFSLHSESHYWCKWNNERWWNGDRKDTTLFVLFYFIISECLRVGFEGLVVLSILLNCQRIMSILAERKHFTCRFN